MIIYLSGPITGHDDYREKFAAAEARLKAAGHTVLNPAVLPGGLEYEQYMGIGFAMLDPAEAIYMLQGWKKSAGAWRELHKAQGEGKMVIDEELLLQLMQARELEAACV